MPGTYQQPSSLGEGNSRPPVTAVPQERVRDYLGVSIANLVCCCLPLGLAALLYSIQVGRSAILDAHIEFKPFTFILH
uniref:Uncharacterized protein n=1 Tax=Xenopus tropicalis TaxID=8364 RepID=A0A6I8R8F7_XENTR